MKVKFDPTDYTVQTIWNLKNRGYTIPQVAKMTGLTLGNTKRIIDKYPDPTVGRVGEQQNQAPVERSSSDCVGAIPTPTTTLPNDGVFE